MKTTLIGLLFVFNSALLHAQTDSASSPLQFKVSVNYNSYLHFYGRTDAVKSTGFFPLAELWVDSQFYVNAAPVFVSSGGSSLNYAGTVASAGYQKLTAKWLLNVYVTKPFYQSSAQLVQSALKAQTGITISRFTPLLSFTLGGDVKFSGNTDFGASAGVDKPIRLQVGQGKFVIDPTIMAYAGTQRFSNSYTQRKKGVLGLPAGNETVTTQSQSFNLLAYEASLPLIYLRGKWMAVIAPAYVVPQNLITIPGQPELSEKGAPEFYGSMTLRFSF